MQDIHVHVRLFLPEILTSIFTAIYLSVSSAQHHLGMWCVTVIVTQNKILVLQ